MHISASPLTPDDFPECAPLWPDRAAYTNDEFARALSTCGALLRDGRATGAVIREAKHLRAYGISAFVHERFAEDYLTCPHPQLGKRLLLEETNTGVVLDWDDIAERNAGGGLQLVIVTSNYDVNAREPMLILGETIRTFIDVHRGYRVARVIYEALGRAAVEMVSVNGDFDVRQTLSCLSPDVPVPSALGVLTRARAESKHSSMLGVFTYNPPRISLTRAEQHLVRAGLDGAPDEVVAARLSIPVSAVKARWTRIYQRVAQRLPGLVEHVRAPHAGDRRGSQIRHLVLEYIRQNPSELTPYRRTHEY